MARTPRPSIFSPKLSDRMTVSSPTSQPCLQTWRSHSSRLVRSQFGTTQYGLICPASRWNQLAASTRCPCPRSFRLPGFTLHRPVPTMRLLWPSSEKIKSDFYIFPVLTAALASPDTKRLSKVRTLLLGIRMATRNQLPLLLSTKRLSDEWMLLQKMLRIDWPGRRGTPPQATIVHRTARIPWPTLTLSNMRSTTIPRRQPH